MGIRVRSALVMMLLWCLGPATLSVSAQPEAVVDTARARFNYMVHCQGCHLPDGRGFPGRVPDMRESLSAFVVLPEGRAFLVRVPGAATSSLSSLALAELMNWMFDAISLTPRPEGVHPYGELEVDRLRREPLVNVMELRRTLVQRSGLLDRTSK